MSPRPLRPLVRLTSQTLISPRLSSLLCRVAGAEYLAAERLNLFHVTPCCISSLWEMASMPAAAGAAGAASLTCSANGKSGLRRGRCRSDRHPQRMCQQDRRVPLFLKCELFVCEKDARVFNVNIRPSSPPERETDSAVRPRAVPL